MYASGSMELPTCVVKILKLCVLTCQLEFQDIMEETGQRNYVLKYKRSKHTNVVKHELISFFSLFLTLHALLIIYFPDKSDITAPAMPISLAYTKLHQRKNKLSRNGKPLKQHS